VPAASVVGEMAKLGESLSRADSEQVGGRP
jgi:hypothetical protein